MRTRIIRIATLIASIGSLVGIFPMTHDDTRAQVPGINGLIAFEIYDSGSDTQHIWTMTPDGNNRTQVTNGDSADFTPEFSPDGAQIVYFAASNEGGGGLRIATLNTNDDDGVPGTEDAGPAGWSPDGSMLIYESEVTHNEFDIVTNDLNGNVVNLTNTLGVQETSPVYTPDGKRIVFLVGSREANDIWVMNADGSNRQQVTNTPEEVKDALDVSPDGLSVVFQVTTDLADTFQIARVNLDGTGFTKITTGLEDDNPQFSPDGTQVVFDRYIPAPIAGGDAIPQGGPGDKYHIFLVSATGGGETDISPDSATGDTSPSWQRRFPLGALVWGDNNCSGVYNAQDALHKLAGEAGVADEVDNCPELGLIMHTSAFGEQIWGDLNCSGSFDGQDVLLLFNNDAGLPPANLQNCPALGVEVTLFGSLS